MLRYAQASPFRHHIHIHMVNINNSELKKAFSDSTKTQLTEQPNNVENRNVIPIIDVTPLKHKKSIAKFGTLTNGTSAIIYTTPLMSEFYLTGFHIGYIKDATATTTSVGLLVTDENNIAIYFELPHFTLTAGSGSFSREFTFPMKLAKNSTVRLVSGTGVANITVKGTILGYIDDAL